MLSKINIESIKDLSKKAGNKTMKFFNLDNEVKFKSDLSPLTKADKASNDIIIDYLDSNYPSIPIISEEKPLPTYKERKCWDYFWLIDPLDGTKEFIKGNTDFTINIALINNNIPVLGAVYQPCKDHLYWAIKGQGAWKDESGKITKLEGGGHYLSKSKVSLAVSNSHISDDDNKFINELKKGKEVTLIPLGSSLKICKVAEGSVDVYTRFGPTMEWDTAAAQIIATESNRKVNNIETSQLLTYNKESLLNPHFIVE